MSGEFAALWGTIKSYFLIGGTGGVRLKHSTGSLHVRNSDDSAFADATVETIRVNGNTIILDDGDDPLTIENNSAQSGPLTITLPPAKSTDGYVLAQKAGTASDVIEFEFVSAASTTSCTKRDTTTLAFGSSSPVTMFQLPANAVLDRITVIVDTAFDGTPTMTVGISGTASKYVGSTDVDLTTQARFTIANTSAANGSAEDLIITYSAGGATVGSARVIVDYSTPA